MGDSHEEERQAPSKRVECLEPHRRQTTGAPARVPSGNGAPAFLKYSRVRLCCCKPMADGCAVASIVLLSLSLLVITIVLLAVSFKNIDADEQARLCETKRNGAF